MLKLILADNQAIFRAGIAKVLAVEDEMRIVAQAQTAEQMFMALDKFRAAVLIIAGGFHSDFNSVLSAANKNKTRVVVLADTGESAQRVRATWQRELMAHLDKHKRYPANALKGAEILVSFVLDRMGHVLSSSVVKGSGDPAFDAAALSMLKRSDPVPQPPPLVADEGLTFTLPVIFRVKGKG